MQSLDQERASAQIITFPPRLRGTTPRLNVDCDTSPDPADRMQHALAKLATAQQEQRAAIAKWRVSLTMLNRSVQELSVSLEATQRRLTEIAALPSD